MAHRDQIDNLRFNSPDEGYFYYLKKSHDTLAYAILQYALVILAVLSWTLEVFHIYIKLAHLILFAFLGLVISQFFYKKHLKKNIARNREAAKNLVNNYHHHPRFFNKFMEKDQNSFTKLPIAQIFYNQYRRDRDFGFCFDFNKNFIDWCCGESQEGNYYTEEHEYISTLSPKASARLSTAYDELVGYIELIFGKFIIQCFHTGNTLESALEFRKSLECYQELKDFLKSFKETLERPVVQEFLKKNLRRITNEIDFTNKPFTISYKSCDSDTTNFDIGIPMIDEALIEIDLRFSQILRRLRLPLTAMSCNSRGIKKCKQYIAEFRPNFDGTILDCHWGVINDLQLSFFLLKWYEIQDISSYSHPNKALLRPLLIDFIDLCKKTLSNSEPLSCDRDDLCDDNWYRVVRRNEGIENYLGDALLILNALDHKSIRVLLNQVLDFLPKLAASLVNHFFKGHIARSMKKDLLGDDWKIEFQKV